MSSFDVYPGEMHGHLPLHDEAIEATLAGRAPADRPDLAALTTFFEEVRTTFEQGPAPRVGPELARLMEAGLGTDQSDLPVTAGSYATAPEGQVAGLSKWRRGSKRVLGAVFGTLIGQAAVASVAAASVMGGLGAKGMLPDPLQSAVSAVADVIGVELPSGHDGAHDRRIQGGDDDQGEVRPDGFGNQTGDKSSADADELIDSDANDNTDGFDEIDEADDLPDNADDDSEGAPGDSSSGDSSGHSGSGDSSPGDSSSDSGSGDSGSGDSSSDSGSGDSGSGDSGSSGSGSGDSTSDDSASSGSGSGDSNSDSGSSGSNSGSSGEADPSPDS